jgi:hypothetical protein
MIRNDCWKCSGITLAKKALSKWRNAIFSHGATAPSGASSLSRLQDHAHSDTPHSVIPLDEWSARRRYLELTTQHTHNRQIQDLRGNRTHNPSKRTVADHGLDGADSRIGEEIPYLYVFWTVELDGGIDSLKHRVTALPVSNEVKRRTVLDVCL